MNKRILTDSVLKGLEWVWSFGVIERILLGTVLAGVISALSFLVMWAVMPDQWAAGMSGLVFPFVWWVLVVLTPGVRAWMWRQFRREWLGEKEVVVEEVKEEVKEEEVRELTPAEKVLERIYKKGP